MVDKRRFQVELSESGSVFRNETVNYMTESIDAILTSYIKRYSTLTYGFAVGVDCRNVFDAAMKK